MFVASVFNWDKLNYDYYEVEGERSIGGWDRKTAGLGISGRAASIPDGMKKIGVALEEVLPELPANARKVSSGDEAIGQIMVIRDESKHALAGLKRGAPGAIPFRYLFAGAAGGTLGIVSASMSDEGKPPSLARLLASSAIGFIAGVTLAWGTRKDQPR